MGKYTRSAQRVLKRLLPEVEITAEMSALDRRQYEARAKVRKALNLDFERVSSLYVDDDFNGFFNVINNVLNNCCPKVTREGREVSVGLNAAFESSGESIYRLLQAMAPLRRDADYVGANIIRFCWSLVRDSIGPYLELSDWVDGFDADWAEQSGDNFDRLEADYHKRLPFRIMRLRADVATAEANYLKPSTAGCLGRFSIRDERLISQRNAALSKWEHCKPEGGLRERRAKAAFDQHNDKYLALVEQRPGDVLAYEELERRRQRLKSAQAFDRFYYNVDDAPDRSGEAVGVSDELMLMKELVERINFVAEYFKKNAVNEADRVAIDRDLAALARLYQACQSGRELDDVLDEMCSRLYVPINAYYELIFEEKLVIDDSLDLDERTEQLLEAVIACERVAIGGTVVTEEGLGQYAYLQFLHYVLEGDLFSADTLASSSDDCSLGEESVEPSASRAASLSL